MCFIERAKEPHELSTRLVWTWSFRTQIWHCCSPFSQVEYWKGKVKAFNRRASTAHTSFVLVCTLSSYHTVFSLFQVCHAPVCFSPFVHRAWSFLHVRSDQGPQVCNGMIDRVSRCGWGAFHFFLCHLHQLKCVISCCSGFRAYQNSNVSGHSEHVCKGDQRLVLPLHFDYTHLEILSLPISAHKAWPVSKLLG